MNRQGNTQLWGTGGFTQQSGLRSASSSSHSTTNINEFPALGAAIPLSSSNHSQSHVPSGFAAIAASGNFGSPRLSASSPGPGKPPGLAGNNGNRTVAQIVGSSGVNMANSINPVGSIASSSEDFPALPGAASKNVSDSIKANNSASPVSKSTIVNSAALPNSSSINSSSSALANGFSNANTVNSAVSVSEKSTQLKAEKPISKSKREPTKLSDNYGLTGLLSVIRQENSSQMATAIGNDLTNMGLDMNPSEEPLSKAFASPWSETELTPPPVPDFKLPSCYLVNSLPLQEQRLVAFDDETLFYLFYTLSRDQMQELAAVELTNRNWRYHKELQLWLTKDPMSEPIQQNPQAEVGVYIFFDPKSWSKVKKEYVLNYHAIA
ncbi:hypothetical protein NADFUDRAFT_49460 [Nadsonia fulvescens var. elongata DSM 6958]|uniref:NOT2/NOT3/NOT5 C-terminal domain-containing protein n=1 Tax=Nadsonia fulvescens var. elongata DSM 6958 TaxID=857566 RepID=A0A1E3PNK1_9ASCO|nr:hypothetical protein NADFUDRAFT_49460 [Nadsonia fulvescens var. elongata DSM 6958]